MQRVSTIIYTSKYSRKEVGNMLEQILTQAMSHIQLITGILLLTAVALELIHIRQTSRINKKLSYAGRWLQRYLNAVFNEEAHNEPEDEDTDTKIHVKEQDQSRAEQVQFTVSQPQPLKSRQEENMRLSLAHKKQKKDEELLESVLQEIFD